MNRKASPWGRRSRIKARCAGIQPAKSAPNSVKAARSIEWAEENISTSAIRATPAVKVRPSGTVKAAHAASAEPTITVRPVLDLGAASQAQDQSVLVAAKRRDAGHEDRERRAPGVDQIQKKGDSDEGREDARKERIRPIMRILCSRRSMAAGPGIVRGARGPPPPPAHETK